jgi:Ca2+-binding RTX toxin-like protein
VTVNVDDASVGSSPDVTSSTYVLQVTDVSPETVTGTTGAETLTGSGDIDMIFGLGGNDTLNGAGGNDTLTGGLGKDMLTGGLGADTFDFNIKTESMKGANHDVIMDFSHVEGDHIDVHDIDAKKGPGNQDFKFIGAQSFHHKTGELHFVKHGTFVTVEGDIDGNGTDFQIEVHNLTNNLHSLAKGDFILWQRARLRVAIPDALAILLTILSEGGGGLRCLSNGGEPVA